MIFIFLVYYYLFLKMNYTSTVQTLQTLHTIKYYLTAQPRPPSMPRCFMSAVTKFGGTEEQEKVQEKVQEEETPRTLEQERGLII